MLKIHWWLRTQVSEEQGRVVAIGVGDEWRIGMTFSDSNQSDKRLGMVLK